MDFAEAYSCKSQNEIQSAYWSPNQVNIDLVFRYYKKLIENISHQSFAFISDESSHDATFVYTRIGKMVPLPREIVPDLEMNHCWTDSPVIQYRNKTIFKVISYHEEFFGCKASWNYMEAGHGKRTCDTIGGTAKLKDDQVVKNRKYIISGWCWLLWDCRVLKLIYLSIEDYGILEVFHKTVCQNIQTVIRTMKNHTFIFSITKYDLGP